MTPDQLRDYALSKPGAWPDQPWEGDVVAKVGEAERGKIFAFLGDDAVDESYALVVAKLPKKHRPEGWDAR